MTPTTIKATPRKIAILLALHSLSLTQFYLYFGGTTYGRQWFRDAASSILLLFLSGRRQHHYSNDNNSDINNANNNAVENDNDDVAKLAGALVLVVVLTLPVLIAGSACVLLLTRSNSSSTLSSSSLRPSKFTSVASLPVDGCKNHGDANNNSSSHDSNEDIEMSILLSMENDSGIPNDTCTNTINNLGNSKSNNKSTKYNTIQQKLSKHNISKTFTSPPAFATTFIILPCLFFFLCNVQRHYQSFAISKSSGGSAIADTHLTSDYYNMTMIQAAVVSSTLNDAVGNRTTFIAMKDSYSDHEDTSSFIEEQTTTEQQQQQNDKQHQQNEQQQQQNNKQHQQNDKQQNKQMLSQLLTHLANDSAILALLTFSHLLLPVSKNSPLVVLLHWSPMEAVVVHQWAGRLGIGACVLHGVLHLMGKWWRLMDDDVYNDVYSGVDGGGRMASLWYEFLPPKSCWINVFQGWPDWLTDAFILATGGSTTVNDEGTRLHDKMVFKPEECVSGVNEDGVPCKMCLDYFVNLTGLLGLMALVILLVGSLGFVRRNYYRAFYIIHITAAPLFLIMTILHYNRAILYVCPSLLYYASTTIPTYVESWMSRRRHCQGTRIISITKIPTLSNNDQRKGSVLDIMFAASPEAMEQFRPGHYCTLHVPSLSLVAHPFTVNLVPGYNDRLRILMRQVGPFTTQLANMLITNSQCKNEMNDEEEVDLQLLNPCITSLPPMQINGFNGAPHRMDQLQQHDAVALIAGGIGITPHLSMLMKLITMSCENNEDDSASFYSLAPLKMVELHWMCRDDSLIRYIHEHYFLAMLQHCPKWTSKGCPVSFKVIVHYTGKAIEISNDPSSLLRFVEPTIVFLEQPSSGSKMTRGISTKSTTPMTPSHFSVGEQKDIHQNAFKFVVTFTSIFSLGLASVWNLFTRFQSKEEMLPRLWVLCIPLVMSLGISMFANGFIMVNHHKHSSKSSSHKESLRSRSSAGGSYGSFATNDISMKSSNHAEDKHGNSPNFQNARLVQLNHRVSVAYEYHTSGRPSPETLLSCLNGSVYPGLFMCGPKSMLTSLREALHDENISDNECAIYEDVFES